MEGQERILIIDDDVDFVAATKTILESNAYDVITANRGVEGLDTAKLEKPDLIILDVIMPAMDGFTVAEQLKNICLCRSFPSPHKKQSAAGR
jgi:CheY-like chemotaxis protein